MAEDYSVPEFVRAHLAEEGYGCAADDMLPYINDWWAWMRSEGSFYDYSETDAAGRRFKVHRRSIRPAMRMCEEWGSLLLNDKTVIDCGKQRCTDWLAGFLSRIRFLSHGQANLVRAFALGTAAWAIWLDLDAGAMQVRRYDARQLIPLSWDDDGVTECAFVTAAVARGRRVTQLQMHLLGDDGYVIKTVCFDSEGRKTTVDGVKGEHRTGCPTPTFAILKPAVDNTRVDASPYGQSIFADAVDAVQAVDLAYDAMVSEVDLSKMRIFLADTMFDIEQRGKDKRPVAIPFGKNDCTIYRKVASTEDLIHEFAPALRTKEQGEVFRMALQTLGDLCGFGLAYFDFDASGYIKTATEVSSDNSALMRNIRRHENLLEGSLATIARAILHCGRSLGARLPREDDIRVAFDDSIITDVYTEKRQDLEELGRTLLPYEYRMKWYGEDEATAKARAAELRVE